MLTQPSNCRRGPVRRPTPICLLDAANLTAIVALVRGVAGVSPVWLRTTPSDDAIHNAKLGQKGVEWYRFQADNDAYRCRNPPPLDYRQSDSESHPC